VAHVESEKGIQMADKKQVPLGAPLPLSDADLDALAVVTPDDIEAAAKLWRETVPEELKDLLDTTEVMES
jgi:hypothetical protein